jgi:hypothetical protein
MCDIKLRVYGMSFSRRSSVHVLAQVVALCLRLCQMKGKDVTEFFVLTEEGGGGAKGIHKERGRR